MIPLELAFELSLFLHQNPCMPNTKRKKKRKKIRYSKLTIKLSTKQKKSLANYCNARKTTPTKLIKKSIKRYISGFDKRVPEEYFATENQLELFEEKVQHEKFENTKKEDNSKAQKPTLLLF